MIYYAWAITSDVLALLICTYALVRGGPAERGGAAVIGIGWILSIALQTPALGLNQGIFLVDVVGLVLLAWISLRSRKIWTLCCAAFQFNAVAIHVVAYCFPRIGVVSILTVIGFWGGYGLLAALGGGMISVERERRRAR